MHYDSRHGFQSEAEHNRLLIDVGNDIVMYNPCQYWDNIEWQNPTRKSERCFILVKCICLLFCTIPFMRCSIMAAVERCSWRRGTPCTILTVFKEYFMASESTKDC
jgi:hypothetical protein